MSAKTAPWQKPWLQEFLDERPFAQEQVTGVLWRMAQRQSFRRALVLIGWDEGYWREERVVARDVGWWAITDSHRAPAAERTVSVVAAGLALVFDRVYQVCTAPPPGAIVRFPGWVEEDANSHASAVPVLAYQDGGKAVVARGFQLDRWLWSLLEQAKAPPEGPPRFQHEP
jgi:hypothetical protein